MNHTVDFVAEQAGDRVKVIHMGEFREGVGYLKSVDGSDAGTIDSSVNPPNMMVLN